jgi:hypothetical protein
MSRVLTQRVAARIPEAPLEFWLNRLDTDTRKANRSHFNRWMRWLHTQLGWQNVTDRDLLVRQLESEDPYIVLDLLQAYVNSLVLRKSSKRKAYSTIRSFFAHNRCGLPEDPSFRVRGDKPSVQGKLATSDIRDLVLTADLRCRSMILFKWQSFLDNERLIYTNVHCAQQVLDQIKKNLDPVCLDLPGRKSNENDSEGNFYTYIGTDAISSLKEYFEKVRGWPKTGEPVWIYLWNKPLRKPAFESQWLRLLRRAGKIPEKKGEPGVRYGYGLHEMRDAATTLLHTHAKSHGFDMDTVKLWCGQVGEIDPLKYDKFYREKDYVQQQYLIAEPYLNIVSNPTGASPMKALEDPSFIKSLVKNEEFLQALKTALKCSYS